MRNTSELIKEIVKSPLAQRGLDYITPVYGNAVTALWIMEVMGREFDPFLQWVEEYPFQLSPSTATWALPYYEQEYAIATNETLSLAQRRAAVQTAMRARAPMNPVKLAEFITLNTALPAKIIENTAKNTFSIVLLDANSYGKYVLKAKKIADSIKPAHLIYEIYVKLEPIIFHTRNEGTLYGVVFGLKNANLGIKSIYLEGNRILDGTWRLALVFEKGIRLKKLKMKAFAQEKMEGRLLSRYFIKGAKADCNADVYEAIFSAWADNLGIIEPILNGRKTINGDWYLTSLSLQKGVRLKQVYLSFGKKEADKLSASRFKMAAKKKTAQKAQSRHFYQCAKQKHKQKSRIYSFAYDTAIFAQYHTKTEVVTDTMYYLDGVKAYLNGHRKCNADIIRSEC